MEAQTCGAIGLQARAQLAQEATLADAGFAREHYYLAFAVLSQLPAPHEEAEFVFAADEPGELAAVHRFEAALGNRHALDCPTLDGLGKALEFVPAEIAQPEATTKEPARRRGD